MAGADDAATVLEQFVHDVANLPAEIAHLLEEIQAKDQVAQECRQQIMNRDNGLQRHIKQMGAHVKHPKEEQMTKLALANYDRAQTLQEDKIALVQKACFLLDRQVKRLDVKIRDLATEGNLTIDNTLPSLLHDSPANLVPPVASGTSTGVNTPMNTLPYSAGSSTNVANAAMARMAAAAQANRNGVSSAPIAGMQPHPLLGGGVGPLTQRQREPSAGAPDAKRRRLNINVGAVPIPSSGLRQTSLGPSTPKAGTPVSRAGSAGPRPKKIGKKVAPHQQLLRKKVGKGGLSKKSARRLLGESRASPSTGDDPSDASGSEEDADPATAGHDGTADDEGMDDKGYDDEGDDNRLYCTCQTVSHGNMVACDNENCVYEWFHWICVGLTQEPKGRWLCPECKKLPANQVKLMK